MFLSFYENKTMELNKYGQRKAEFFAFRRISSLKLTCAKKLKLNFFITDTFRCTNLILSTTVVLIK